MTKLMVPIIVSFMLFSMVQAKEETSLVSKTICASTFGQEQKQFQEELLTRTKRAVVEEVCGSLVKSFSHVKNLRLQHDEIESYSMGFVRIKGDPVQSHGKNIGEVCLTIDAEITSDDCDKITKPKQLSKKACVCEGDIKTIKKRTEQKAKLEVLFDYDQNLRQYSIEKLLPLLREVTFSEGNFVEGTSVYCVKATGSLYPIEVFALKVKEGKPTEQFVQGLTAEYFNLPPFSNAPGNFWGQPIFKRIDKAVNFSWKGIPAPDVSADYFGAKWTGMIYLPKIGNYSFSTNYYRGGIKWFIDGRSVVDSWDKCSHCGKSSNIYFQGGKWYPITIQYFHTIHSAQISLSWQIPGSDSKGVIPSGYFRTKPLVSE